MPRKRSSSGPNELRRLYRRFTLLVVLPVIVLLGFGALAIRNDRAAVESRFRDEYTRRLHGLAKDLITSLETEANTLVRGTRMPTQGLVLFQFRMKDHVLIPSRSIDGHLSEALSAALRAFSPPPNGSVALMPASTGPASGLYAVRELPDHTLAGLAFSRAAIARSVEKDAAYLFPGDGVRYTVDGPPDTPVAAINPLMAILNEIVTDDIQSGVVSLPLPGALGDWRIEANLPASDPVRQALWRNEAVYIVTLGLCALAIALGIFVTLRGVWNEAQLSRLKTDFVSNISHEMRTPLASIRMFAETLRQGRAQSPEEQAACLEFITRESERLTVIAERTLDWARIESGGQMYTLKRSPSLPLIQRVVDTFRARGLVGADVLSLSIEPELPDVAVDATAFSQVVMNLLENAVKYTGAEKRIQVRARRHGKWVCFDVEDNGHGIGDKDQTRIFERFYRVDDLLSRRTEGTGLGLSIAQRIVEAHKGKLTVKSILGRGSVFTVSLPAVLSVRSDSAATRPQERLA